MRTPTVDLHRGFTLLIDDGTGAAWDVVFTTPQPVALGPQCSADGRLAPFAPTHLADPHPSIKNLAACGLRLFGPLDPTLPDPASGARAGWGLLNALALLYLNRASSEVPLTHVLIENLEAHLHPQQQLGLVLVLARAVRDGLRVVATTSSLTVVYAVNNLVQAGRLGDRRASGLPLPEVRLPKGLVVAYHCVRGQDPADVVDPETGFISEAVLGETSAYLQDEMSLICRHLPS